MTLKPTHKYVHSVSTSCKMTCSVLDIIVVIRYGMRKMVAERAIVVVSSALSSSVQTHPDFVGLDSQICQQLDVLMFDTHSS